MRPTLTQKSRRRAIVTLLAGVLGAVLPEALAQADPPRTEAPAEATAVLLPKSQGGLTAADVARRAVGTSYAARAAEEGIKIAASKVSEAWSNYFPKLNGFARYTRHSDFTPPPIIINSTRIAPFALVLDQYVFQATLVVPLSDYFLRIHPAYTASRQAETASRYDMVAVKARAAAEGKAAFYNWLTARAGLVVAEATLELQKTLTQDVSSQFTAGSASRADVLQAESLVAAAELTVEQAKNLVRLTERQVSVAIHAGEGERLVPAEELEDDLPAITTSLSDLTHEAHASRVELKALDASVEAAHAQARASRGARYPSVAAVVEGLYAQPNPRFFPARGELFGTWSVSAQLSWSPNEAFISNTAAESASARAAQLAAQRNATRDGIEIEVMQARQGVDESEIALATTRRQLTSAAEAYRVARELFRHGEASATQAREAETLFTRARLAAISARAQARIARVRLEHAVGRDARDFPP